MIYAINYDLKRPGQNYKGLHDAIKSMGAWWHYLNSTWLVDTDLHADGVWKCLESHVERNDSVLVIGVTKDFTGWLPQKAWDWLNERSSRLAA